MSDTINVTIAGKALVCGHCGNTRFVARDAQLNTSLASFFNLDWMNASADVYVCTACGKLHWFLDKGNIRRECAEDDNYAIECVQCGGTIPAGQTVCSRCGWTYTA